MWICEKDGHCVDSCEGCEHYVEMVEVKRGRWIETKRGFHCSNCKKQPGLHPIKRGVFLSDFCPNCGADMREVDHAV